MKKLIVSVMTAAALLAGSVAGSGIADAQQSDPTPYDLEFGRVKTDLVFVPREKLPVDLIVPREPNPIEPVFKVAPSKCTPRLAILGLC